MIKVISFDLDGTLVDENFDKLIWNLEIPKLYAKRYKLDLEEAKEKVFSEYDKEEKHYRWTDIVFWFEKFNLDGYDELLHDMKHKIKMFPDTVPLLKELKSKYKLIIITSSTKKFLELKIKVDDIEGFFSKIFSTPDDFKKRKKDSEVYSEVLNSLKLKPEEIIHIGDSYEADYLSPKKLGIKAFFLDRSKERTGECIVHDLNEFKEKIRCIN